MTGSQLWATADDGVRRGSSARIRVHELNGAQVRHREDRVATEEPMQIRLRAPGTEAVPVVVTMRTPGADFELAVGFVRAEAMIDSGSDVARVAYCGDAELTPPERYNVVTVDLARPPLRSPAPRYAAMSAACGVCGKQSLDDLERDGFPRPTTTVRLDPDILRALPDRLRATQDVFTRTGGLHACGLFDTAGELLCVREDVGRHNAADKVIGWALLQQQSLTDTVLVASGRAGFEILHKAAMVGIPFVAAVGAPSSLAVDLAERAGTTLVGFLRGERFVTYTRPERVSGLTE